MSRTVVCLASYFKGVDFLRECHALGARVILIVREKVRNEPWPEECLDRIVTLPNQLTAEIVVDAVAAIAGLLNKPASTATASGERRSSGVISGACSRLTYRTPRRSSVASSGDKASHS